MIHKQLIIHDNMLKGPYIKYVEGGPEGFCGDHEIF